MTAPATPAGRPVIGLDYISGAGWTGGAIYLRNLVYCLAALSPDERPELRLLGAVDPADPQVAELRSFPFVDPGRPAAAPRAPLLWSRIRRRFLQRVLPPEPAWRGLSATFPTFGAPVAGAAPIHWIPDLQHVHLPHLFSAAETEARSRGMAKIAAGRNFLVLSSHAVAADFAAAFPGATAPVRIWPFCTVLTAKEEGGADPRAAYGLPERYIYLPNQFWTHKNHITAFRALDRLRQRGLDLTVVCTGLEEDHRDPAHMPFLRRFLAENGLADRVRLLGLVPRRDQIEIFRRATFVLQPSLFEGRSTVVEDAKALGRPVLVSDLAVHREQLAGEDAPLALGFFAPTDDAALADRIAQSWNALPSGPDLANAAAVDARRERRRSEAARIFMAIVAEAERCHAEAA